MHINIPNHQQQKPSPDFLAEIKPKVCSCRTIFILGTPGPPLSNCSDMIFRKGGREPSSTTMISFRICLSWAADRAWGKNKPVPPGSAWTWIFHMIFPFDTPYGDWSLVNHIQKWMVMFPWYIQQNVTIDGLSWKIKTLIHGDGHWGNWSSPVWKDGWFLGIT